MYKDLVDLDTPSSRRAIWRYMDLAKLLFILERKSLWFSSITNLDDKYEGLVPLPSVDVVGKTQHDVLERVYGRFRPYTCVNCWHASEHESAAMWKLYLSGAEGVAIRSTVQRLRDSFENARQDVFLGMIKYTDFDSFQKELNKNKGRNGELMWPRTVLRKRMSFKHEQELRALHIDFGACNTKQPPRPGCCIPIDPQRLIQRIYVAPTSPEWFKPVVQSIVEKLGYRVKVEQSPLNEGPV